MIEINLLPGVQRKARSAGPAFSAAAITGILGQLKDRYLILGTGGLAIGLVAIAGMYLFQTKQQRVLDTRESLAAADSARFSAVLKARSRAESQRDSVYQELAIIKSIDDSRFAWPHILQEINLAVPQYTWLTEVAQTSPVASGASLRGDTTRVAARGDSAKKATGARARDAAARARRARADSLFSGAAMAMSFRITGQTVDLQALTLFMKNLEASPFIRNVQLTRSDLVSADNKEVTEFQLEAQTEVPAPHLIQTVPLSLAVH